jgi:hypothetical protein
VWGAPDSLASGIAFKLLKSVLYGAGDRPPLRGTPEVEKLVREYAACLEFRERPTPQMVAAFPVFWGFRYDKIVALAGDPPREMAKDIMFKYYAGRAGDAMVDSPLSAPGMSPLELYGRRLFDEPPLSDALCLAIQEVLLWCEKASNAVRDKFAAKGNGDELYVQFQQDIIRADAKVFNLLRTQFAVGWFDTHRPDRAMKVVGIDQLRHLIGMEGGNQYFLKLPVAWRTPLNGFGAWFAAFMNDSRQFWLIGEPAGNMADMAVRPSEADLVKILERHNAVSASSNPRQDKKAVREQSEINMGSYCKHEPPD